MQRLKRSAWILMLLVLGSVAAELARPPIVANCAECGSGPKDKKCPDGYKCSNGKCVK